MSWIMYTITRPRPESLNIKCAGDESSCLDSDGKLDSDVEACVERTLFWSHSNLSFHHRVKRSLMPRG